MKFEEAYQKLESILKTMNSGQVDLEESLALYEEATLLITTCQKKLAEAETRVEILLKNREGALITDAAGVPEKEPFLS